MISRKQKNNQLHIISENGNVTTKLYLHHFLSYIFSQDIKHMLPKLSIFFNNSITKSISLFYNLSFYIIEILGEEKKSENNKID